MTGLPTGWAVTTVGQVTQRVDTVDPKRQPASSFTYVDISSIDSSNQTIVSPKFLSGHEAPSRARGSGSVRQLLREGDTVFSTVRTYLRNIGYVDSGLDGSVGSTGFSVLRGADGIDPRYLYYHSRTNTFVDGLSAVMRGTSYPAVVNSQVREMPIPIAPKAEQERIVAAIEEQFSRLDAGVAALERLRHNLKRMRGAVLQAALTGCLIKQDPSDGDADTLISEALDARAEHVGPTARSRSAPSAFARNGLPPIPASWRWTSLDSLAEIVGGITKDAKKQASADLVEVPYLRVANVQRGHLNLEHLATIKTTTDQIRSLSLQCGDVLFNEGGDRDKLGRGWVWEGQIDPCIHQNHVFRARLYAPMLDPRWVSWHGNTFGQQWFNDGGKQTTNLASLSKTTLRSFPVPVPPLQEQQRIVAAVEGQLSLIDAVEAMMRAAHQRASSLRSSILAAAFSGSLVPQDPDDERAAVLLERIAADRASSGGRKATAGRARRSTVTAA